MQPNAPILPASSKAKAFPQSTVPLVPGSYQIDRQVLIGTLQSQLVLHHNGNNYQFLRTAETRDRLRRYCKIYERSQHSIVVTEVGLELRSSYGIWEQVTLN